MLKNCGQIGVLMGGCSSERNISLKSGKAISIALKEAGYAVRDLDIQTTDERNISQQLRQAGIDVVFLALHGRFGEDGTIQTILEKAHIPYTGSGVAASQNAFNKELTHQCFSKNDILAATYSVVTQDDCRPDDLWRDFEDSGLVVKPTCEGSSFGVTVVHARKDLEKALDTAFEYGSRILIEKYIKGKELTVGILGETSLPIIEIRPKVHFFDFTAKYEKGQTEYIVDPDWPENLKQRIQTIALNAHKALGCESFSRVDFMLDHDQHPYVLEVNTIPGFTSTSLLPMAAQRQGYSFVQLCEKLIELTYAKKI